ncbi:hypothetical protein [Pedobacter nyackensis]|uniref:hypothetical protein n=1 Tax=Pedobacter nyackensis TaxID=475255 RepID=UPI00293116DF|nr:hypothetical protein [Pedobacter nyackensis]
MKTDTTTQTESTLDAIKDAHLRMISYHRGRGVLFINRSKDWKDIAKDKYVKENFNIYTVKCSKRDYSIHNISDYDEINKSIYVMHIVLQEEELSGKSQKPNAPLFPDELRSKDYTKPIIFFTGRGFPELKLEEELKEYLYN